MNISQVVTVLCGIAAGVVSSLATAELSQPEKPEHSPKGVDVPSKVAVSAQADLSGIESRLRRLEATGEGRESANPEPEEGANPAAAEPHPEAMTREEVEATFASHLQEHDQEPVDGAWSTPSERSLESDLLGGVLERAGSAQLVDVSCRTTSCTAQVQWKSFQEAAGSWSELLHASYSLNCGREIVLPEPPEGTPADAPYRGTLLLDCEEARATEVASAR